MLLVTVILVLAWYKWFISEAVPIRQHPHLTVASMGAAFSEAATGVSAVLTSAVRCVTGWGTCSSGTAGAVSASITGITVSALSVCTAGAGVVPGAAASAVLRRIKPCDMTACSLE